MKEKTIDKQKLLNWLGSAPSELDAEELIKWIGNQIKIKCPNSFIKDWIKANYGSAIEDATESALGQLAEFEAEFEYEVAS